MPNRTMPGDDSFFSRLMDRWQREQRSISKLESTALGFVEEAETFLVPPEDCGWTWTEGELIVAVDCSVFR